MINTSQSNFGDVELDDKCIRDIADVITADNEPQAASDDNPGQTMQLQPRGAILVSTPGDNKLWESIY